MGMRECLFVSPNSGRAHFSAELLSHHNFMGEVWELNFPPYQSEVYLTCVGTGKVMGLDGAHHENIY